MKQYLVLSSLAIVLLSSCGSNSNENGLALGEKKAALEKLKSQKATLDEQIKKMEGEIAQTVTCVVNGLDTTGLTCHHSVMG